ncbi:MAG: DUF1772 domain-containing protein [Dehalococcoidia bacterium]
MSALAAVAAAVTLALVGGMAGLFFAFSTSVMPGLDGIKADQAIRAMQSINRKILNPMFLTGFVGAPVAALASGVFLLLDEQASAAIIFFLAAAAYVLGAFLPTAVINVPMNNALDAASVPADVSEADRLWAGYSPRWTRWNHLRTVSCSVSLLLVGLALFAWGREW